MPADHHPLSASARMQFSVVIPLEYHRGQGMRCLEAWCRDQEFPHADYEVLCVMPRTYPELGRKAIQALLRPHDRLVESEGAHDIALCVEGAAASQGETLFFTEAHVWSEPNVLKACAEVLERNPKWAAFCCKTTRVTSNLLAAAEADMYERDIAFGMNIHPWLKMCFVTRRDPYFATGGFNPRFGHFAEWVLSAQYYKQALTIGYAPHIKLYHYYIGELGELDAFTRDFLAGEMRYFAEAGSDETLMEPPWEWLIRGNFNRDRAHYLVTALWHYGTRRRVEKEGPGLTTAVRQLAAYSPVAIGLPNVWLASRRRLCWTMLQVAQLRSSRQATSRWFLAYQKALIAEERLRLIATPARSADSASRSSDLSFGEPDSAGATTGFHLAEISDGRSFRWSEPAAVAEIAVPAGKLRLRLQCLYVPQHLTGTLVFFFNGKRVPQRKVVVGKDTIELSVKSREAGVSRLLWMCEPLVEPGTKRRLGLPAISLSVERRVQVNQPD